MGTDAKFDGGTTGNWLEDTLRPFRFLTAVRERTQTRRICGECLDIYQAVKAGHPACSGPELYALVIARRLGADPARVADTLERIEESFASWPKERPINFRDVVQYLAITECLEGNPSETGVRARVSAVVSEIIPAKL